MELSTINKMETLREELLKGGYQPIFTIKHTTNDGDILIMSVKISSGDTQKIMSIANHRNWRIINE